MTGKPVWLAWAAENISDIRVRSAAKDDFDSIVKFRNTASRTTEYIGRTTITKLKSFFENDETDIGIAIDHNNEVVGCIYCAYHDKVWWLMSILVSSRVRGTGVGGRLIDWAISEAMRMKYREAKLAVDSRNIRAEALYKSKGFKVVETDQDHDRNGVEYTYFIMSKRIT